MSTVTSTVPSSANFTSSSRFSLKYEGRMRTSRIRSIPNWLGLKVIDLVVLRFSAEANFTSAIFSTLLKVVRTPRAFRLAAVSAS